MWYTLATLGEQIFRWKYVEEETTKSCPPRAWKTWGKN